MYDYPQPINNPFPLCKNKEVKLQLIYRCQMCHELIYDKIITIDNERYIDNFFKNIVNSTCGTIYGTRISFTKHHQCENKNYGLVVFVGAKNLNEGDTKNVY